MSAGTDGMIAVAMSGGLDSSVAAWLLSRREPAVVGLSMLLWSEADEPRHGRCCGALDLGDAQRVAAHCGIPHYTLRMEGEFRRAVVDPFVQGYLNGETPIPCTACNSSIKFGLLLDRARHLGAERLATGHYARIVEGPDGLELHAALDGAKDQSYYLFELTREQLAAVRFPLGELTKDEVREIARQAGLSVAEKGESMELCFVAGGVREFVEEQLAARPAAYEGRPSEGAAVVDSNGRALGRAEPYYRYTVGQRRGLGVASSERLYVLEVRKDDNAVVVGGRDELAVGGLIGDRAHWIGEPPRDGAPARVKIRARHAGVGCTVEHGAGSEIEIRFDEPQLGVAPGQAAVLYDGSRVLGGCWISAPLR